MKLLTAARAAVDLASIIGEAVDADIDLQPNRIVVLIHTTKGTPAEQQAAVTRIVEAFDDEPDLDLEYGTHLVVQGTYQGCPTRVVLYRTLHSRTVSAS